MFKKKILYVGIVVLLLVGIAAYASAGNGNNEVHKVSDGSIGGTDGAQDMIKGEIHFAKDKNTGSSGNQQDDNNANDNDNDNNATPTPTTFDSSQINASQVVITTTHGNITLQQVAEIQPGLGTVMMEYANRFWSMFYAAQSGNWDLASYQMKEMLEIQEVGETTRTGRAPALKAFESAFLVPLNDTITAKNLTMFQTAYNNTIGGCNGCHAGNGFPFIHYSLPSNPPAIP